MFCTQCGAPLRGGASFCGNCGWTIPSSETVRTEVEAREGRGLKLCVKCRSKIPIGAEVCRRCGNPQQDTELLGKPAIPAPAAREVTRNKFIDVTKLFSATGRIGRKDYWIIQIASIAMIIGYAVIVGFLVTDSNPESRATTWALVPCIVFVGILGIFTNIKRVHDFGWSGWVVLASLIPPVGFVCLILSLFMPGDPAGDKYGHPNSGTPFPGLHS